MIRHAWTVLADKVISDGETSNLLLSEVSQLSVEPAAGEGSLIPCRIEVVSFWYRETSESPENGSATLRVRGPHDEAIVELPLTLEFHGYFRFRTRAVLNGLPFVGVGVYYFDVSLDKAGESAAVARVPLFLNPLSEDPPADRG